MQRYLQFTVAEPLEPTVTPNKVYIQTELAVIGIDLYTGHVTLPGGFVCTLASLTTVIDKMRTTRREWIWSGHGPCRKIGNP